MTGLEEMAPMFGWLPWKLCYTRGRRLRRIFLAYWGVA